MFQAHYIQSKILAFSWKLSTVIEKNTWWLIHEWTTPGPLLMEHKPESDCNYNSQGGFTNKANRRTHTDPHEDIERSTRQPNQPNMCYSLKEIEDMLRQRIHQRNCLTSGQHLIQHLFLGWEATFQVKEEWSIFHCLSLW